MKWLNLLIWMSILGGGIACGYLLSPTSNETIAKGKGSRSLFTKADSSSRQSRDVVSMYPVERLRGLVDDYFATYKPDEQEELLAPFLSSEMPPMLEGFTQLSGFRGLDYKSEETFKALICHWYENAENDALNWIYEIEPETDRLHAMAALVEWEAEREIGKALALVWRFSGESQTGRIKLPSDFGEKVFTYSRDEFLKLCAHPISADESSFAARLTYPNDFDFQSFAERLRDSEAQVVESGKKLNLFPSNILTEWAKRSPEEAIEWEDQNTEKESRNWGYYDLVEGLIYSNDEAELGQILGRYHSEEHEKYKHLNFALRENSSGEVYRNFLEAASAQIPKWKINNAVVKKMFHELDNDSTRLRAVLGVMPAKEQIRVLTKGQTGRHVIGRYREDAVKMLVSLGHSQSAAEVAIPLKWKKPVKK